MLNILTMKYSHLIKAMVAKRHALGLTQAQLAKRLKLAQSTVCRLEFQPERATFANIRKGVIYLETGQLPDDDNA